MGGPILRKLGFDADRSDAGDSSDTWLNHCEQEAQLTLSSSRRLRFDHLALGIIAIGAVVVLSGGEDSPIKCPVHSLTGLHCPGCGGQRAVQELLQGDVSAALGQNALMFTAPIFFLALPLAKSRKWLEYLLIGAVAFLTLAFVILRNLPGSPLAPK